MPENEAPAELDAVIAEIPLVLNKILPKNWRHTRQDRPFHGFILVLSGTLHCRFSDSEETVPADEILYLAKGSSYEISSGDEQLEYIIVNFQLDEAVSLNPAKLLRRRIVPQDKLHMNAKFRKLDELYFYMPSGYRIEMRSCLYSILYRALHASMINNCTGDERRLLPSVQFMRDSFNTDVTLDEIAAKSGISTSHFRKLFHGYYKMTPKEYITSLRINSAKTLLLASELSINEIAERTGFNDTAYFCKIFRAETGVTPNRFRRDGNFDNTL